MIEKIRDDVYKKYKNSINMSFKEYKDFLEDKNSIIGRKNARDNRLVRKHKYFIKKPVKKWNDNDIMFAMKIVSRIKQLKQSVNTGKFNGYNIRTLKLMNFAFNPNKR